MSDVTRILSQIESGEPSAAEKLLPLVYEELRKLAVAKLAQEKPGQTLQATALVHDAYLKLVDTDQAQHWNSRGHFFGAAAEAMRRILVDSAKRKQAVKRGGEVQRVGLDEDQILAPSRELVKLRFFAGLTIKQAAGVLRISESTADADWAYAKSWLRVQIAD